MKERIQTKAHELFMRFGFRSVTVDEIARQLGVSKKTIYQHFQDKDALVDAVMMSEIEFMTRECLCQQTRSVDAVDEILQDMKCMDKVLEVLNPLIMTDMEKFHPNTFVRFRQHKNTFMRDIIEKNLIRGQQEGLYRPDLDVDIVARLRLEGSFLMFNQEQFPLGRYSLGQIGHEINMLYLHSVVTSAGREKMYQYLSETQPITTTHTATT